MRLDPINRALPGPTARLIGCRRRAGGARWGTLGRMVDVRGRWRVVSVGGRAADGEAELTFDADGGVAGRPGVNRVRAAFTLDGDELTCAPFVTTRMAGPPELMAQEQTVLEVLTGPSTVTADGDRVVIGAGVTQLVLTSAPG